jgi:tetratricopeptide (TPR) repeat protein
VGIQQLLIGLTEVRGGFVATHDGLMLEEQAPGDGGQSGAVAALLAQLSAFGTAAGLTGLELVVVRAAARTTVTGVRPEAYAQVRLDASQPTAKVERALGSFVPELPVRAAAVRPPAGPRPEASPPPAQAARVAPATSTLAEAFASAAIDKRSDRENADPWAGLRRALVRGQFAEAAAQRRALSAAVAGQGRPGSEPLREEERERVTSLLLEGVGSVLAGDGVGGGRILAQLAAAGQPNLSVRWLALHWMSRAALRSGNLVAARAHVNEALGVSRQLDMEARAVSQWTAAEVLANDGDPSRALAWLKESRTKLERIGDRWGLARTWLTEARVLAATARDAEASEAARRAWEADPEWDEAPVFLACRSILRGALDPAEEGLTSVRTAAADEVRGVIEAIRSETVSQADASEYLRERETPPTVRAVKALERIASVWPRFVLARDALAWMLLKLGKYEDASAVFRGLLDQPLTAHERASVMLGLSCIANAQQSGSRSEARLREVVSAGGATSRTPASGEAEPAELPDLSSSSILLRASAPNTARTAVFSGQLSVFALPDLLEFLRGARRTGLLVCSSPAGIGALRFQEGTITAGASPATETVGAYLVRTGKLTAAELEAAVAAKSSDSTQGVLGEVLVRRGHVEPAAVQEALTFQITQTIRALVKWTEGEFAFNREGEEAQANGAITVAVDSQAVLLDLYRELDEEARDLSSAVVEL